MESLNYEGTDWRKLRFREFKQLVCGHAIKKWQRQGSKPGLWASKSISTTIILSIRTAIHWAHIIHQASSWNIPFKMTDTQQGRHSHLWPREHSLLLSFTQPVFDVRSEPRNESSCPFHCPRPSQGRGLRSLRLWMSCSKPHSAVCSSGADARGQQPPHPEIYLWMRWVTM